MTLKKTIIIFCCLLMVMQSFSQSNTIYGLPVILTSRTNDTTSIFLRTPTKTIPGIAWNAGNGKIEFRIPQDSLFVRDDSIFYQKTNGEQYFVSTISASASAGWNLTGNPGVADTNFLGTTDNEPLIIKVNNSEVFRNGNGYSLWGNGEDNYSVVSKNGVEITKSTTGQSATVIPDYISIINVPNSINVNLGIHGLRPPNMSTTVRGSLAYSTAGNIIWNTDSSKLQYYNGSSWATIGENGVTGDVIDTAGHWLNYLYKKPGSDSIFYVIGNTSTFAYIDETNAVRDTAALKAGWGMIIVDDSSYKPNGTDKTIMPDTSKLALKSELNLITNTDTVNSNFIVDTLSNSPPGYATDGYKVLIGISPTGDFAGHANDVALLVGTTWTFTEPSTNDQLIVDNAKTYSSYQYNGSAWVVTSKLARWGGDKGYGATAFIGRKDNQPFNLRSWNKTFLYGDGNQDVYLPKHNYDSATRVRIYFRPGANGKIDTATFHDLILYRSDFFAISNDTLYVDTTTSSDVGSAAWGGITGTLSDQTDLQTALDDKFNAADFNSSFNTRFATKTTDDLAQGSTNKYYTDALARAAFTSDKPTLLTYNSSTGHFDLDTTLVHTYNFYNTKYVRLDGSYSDPSWITGLAASKITGILSVANGGTGTSSPSLGAGNSIAITGTWPNQTIALAANSTLDSLTITANNLQATIAPKFVLRNTTAATSSIYQNSPGVSFIAQSWNTAGSASYASQYTIYAIGVSGPTINRGKLAIASPSNPTAVLIDYDGSTTFGSNITATYGFISYVQASNSVSGRNQVAAGVQTAGSANFRTTNAGSAVTPTLWAQDTYFSEKKGFGWYKDYGAVFTINNTPSGSKEIAVAAIDITDTSGTTGSEKGALSFYTKPTGSAMLERARITTDGVFTFLSPSGSSGSTPSYTIGTGAGTSATASIAGTDADGLITINTGTTPTAGGNIITITFTATLTNSSKIQLTPYNSPASKTDVYINSDSSGFTIKNTAATDGGSAAPASKTLIFHYTTTQ